MSAKTLEQMVGSVAQNLGAGSQKVPNGMIRKALYNANNYVHSKGFWPWLLARGKIDLNGTYTTGTVTVTDGSTSVTGTGTTWDTSWVNKRLLVGQNNISYAVASVDSATTLTLAEAPHIASTLTNVGYTLYQEVYALPADYEPGKEIAIFNPSIRIRVKKLPPLTLEQQNVVVANLFTNIQTGYRDYGVDANGRQLIKFSPPPSAVSEFSIFYRKQVAPLAAPTSTSPLPESFVQLLEFYAEAEVRRIYLLPGAIEAERRAVSLLRGLKRNIDTQGIDNQPLDHGYLGTDSSFSQGPFSITPGWNP